MRVRRSRCSAAVLRQHWPLAFSPCAVRIALQPARVPRAELARSAMPARNFSERVYMPRAFDCCSSVTGDVFPIHGTCLGFQLLHILEANVSFTELLVDTDSGGGGGRMVDGCCPVLPCCAG